MRIKLIAPIGKFKARLRAIDQFLLELHCTMDGHVFNKRKCIRCGKRSR